MRFSTIIFFILTITIRAQNYEIIQNKISALLKTLPANTKTAILVFNPENGDTIFAKNFLDKMIPASNTKLFTTATALHVFGTDYSVKTSILTDADEFIGNRIKGNIYLKGFGDPHLSNVQMDSLVEQIVAQGIEEIEGDVFGDDTYFDKVYSRDDWITDELSNVPLPPVSALAFNRNSIKINLDASGKTGERIKYSVQPGNNLIEINSTARITKFRSKPQFLVRNNSEGNSVRITGGLKHRRHNFSYALHANDPSQFAANILHKKITDAGIIIRGKTKSGAAPEGSVQIASASTPLEKIIASANKESDNFTAECIFKMLGAKFSGEPGNSFYSTQAVMTFINENNIYSDSTAVVDGSGISRFNEISVASIVDLLKYIYLNDNLFNAFYNSLAVAGVDGTLKDRMFDNFAHNNFHGKTGTLRGVTAVSGYLTTIQENDFIVSIIMEFKNGNAASHRYVQDKIIGLIAESL